MNNIMPVLGSKGKTYQVEQLTRCRSKLELTEDRLWHFVG